MASRDIILYHYAGSPYARRLVWYLQLRNITYTECIQPHILPRPDLTTLGVQYRRIPLLAIGRDIYNDTRLIIRKLNALFPPSAAHPGLASTAPEHAAIEALLDRWVTDGGVFLRATQLIPPSYPALKDPRFTKDRAQMSGRPWSAAALAHARPEALVEIRSAFAFLEAGLLADGRDWILKTPTPTQADLEAVWALHWVVTMPEAIPADVASATLFPKVFAWIGRFNRAVREAGKKGPKPKSIKGDEAAAQILGSDYAEPLGEVDDKDPQGLKKGTEVLVHPIDSGVFNKDRGTLLALSGQEIVIEVKGETGKTVRVHAPRHGFRVVAVADSKI